MKAPFRSPVAVLLCAPLAFFTAFFLAPLTVVVVASFTDGHGDFTFANYLKILLDQYHWDVVLVTFRIAILTTVFCLLVGFPLAWYLVRIVRWSAWRRLCVVMVVIPLFTSNIVLLGRNGLVNDALVQSGLVDRPVRFLGTETGILIGLVYILVPFIVLAVGNAIAGVDRTLEQASEDLGAKPFSTFWLVTLPLSLPGVVAGMVMVFTLAVSAYVTPALLSGGRITVLSMLIFQQYSTVFDFHYGGALSVVLLVLTLVLVSVTSRLGEGRRSLRS